MTRRLFVSLIAPLALLGTICPKAAAGAEAGGLFRRVSSAIESADRAQLADLFPADRKIAVSLHQIADLEGFAGAGPLAEAFHRYLSARTVEPGVNMVDSDPYRLRAVCVLDDASVNFLAFQATGISPMLKRWLGVHA